MKIYQIELTNVCNFDCSYCPRSEMTRKTGFMDMHTLERIIDIFDGDAIRLHHFGESFMHPNITKFVHTIRNRLSSVQIILNTNGSLINEMIITELFAVGLSKLMVSYHDFRSISKLQEIPMHLRKYVEVLFIGDDKKTEIDFLEESGFQTSVKKLRDLGGVKKEQTFDEPAEERCAFIKHNEVVIQWDGDIVPCCEVFDKQSVLGNIHDFCQVKNYEFSMCKHCQGYGNDYTETERK